MNLGMTTGCWHSAVGCNDGMKIVALAVAIHSSPVLAGNFATCLLDKLPAIQNDVAAQAVYQQCEGMYPAGLPAVRQGSGRGLFSFNSGAECTVKKAGETRSVRAAALIGVACRRLYDEPVTFSFEEAFRKK